MIPNASLREQLYAYLKDRIQSGGLEPGAAINLDRMSRELGISKTPLKKPSSSWSARVRHHAAAARCRCGR
jgi:hypothetical protein